DRAAIEGAIEVTPRALGEAITHLPWLCPCAASLVALARDPNPTGWSMVQSDPGAVLLVVRQSADLLSVPALVSFPPLLDSPRIPQAALEGLQNPQLWFVDWGHPSLHLIYRASLRHAFLARRLAEATRLCSPDLAWVAGLVTPLGWWGVCAI